MLDQIPTEALKQCKARTVGVRRRPFVPDALTGIPVLSRGSSDMLGRLRTCSRDRCLLPILHPNQCSRLSTLLK